MPNRKVMIVAGEVSGDQHGAHLVRAMKRREPSLEFSGIGGEALGGAGVKVIFDAHRLSVVGITEALAKFSEILKGRKAALSHMAKERPDLLILIDFPDFNMHLAGHARKLGIKVLYYIGPQIWAWRSGRVKRIRKLVDHMVVILPFEEKFYRKKQVPVTYVGHPLMDGALPVPSDGDPSVMGLLPGSRTGEVMRHLPVMLDAGVRIREKRPVAKFLLPLAPTIDPKLVEGLLSGHPLEPFVEVVPSGIHRVFERAGLVVAASGTVTLETAMSATPMVVIYKVSPMSYRLGKVLIRVKFISLVNLIAGRRIVPELIQDRATPGEIARAATKLLSSEALRGAMKQNLMTVRARLGRGGASDRTARVALSMLRS